jgi:hypothetical protein
MIEQRVNFYPLLERPGKDWLNSAFILFSAGITLFIVGCVYVVLSSKHSALYSQLGDVRAEIDLARKNANELRVVQQRSFDKSIFTKRIKELEAELSLKRQVDHVLSLNPVEGGVGFTKHMEALGSHPMRGMWFTTIKISGGGGDVLLAGKVKNPDLVPRYLQALAAEDVFQGHEFSSLLIQPSETEDWLYDFELRTEPENTKP